MKPLPKATPGDSLEISAEVWNDLVDAVNRANTWSVAPPLQMLQRPSGFSLATAPAARVGLFVVNLTQTGGSDGTQTSAATWVYTATDLAGNVLATGAAPQRPRSAGSVGVAHAGTGYFDGGGDFQLAEAWETPATGHC